MYLKRILTVLILPLCLLSLSGCFEIIHFLDLNKDGSVKVMWKFSMSNTLMESMGEMKDKKGAGGDSPGDAASDMTDIFNQKNEITKKLGKHVKDLKVTVNKDEYDISQVITFTAPKSSRALEHENLPIVPLYDAAKKQIVFDFSSLSKEMADKEKEKSGEGDEMNNPQMEKMGAAMLSTARYKVILGSSFNVKSAELVGKKAGTKKLTVTRLGNQALIDVPFFTAAMLDKSDSLKLIVYLR